MFFSTINMNHFSFKNLYNMYSNCYPQASFHIDPKVSSLVTSSWDGYRFSYVASLTILGDSSQMPSKASFLPQVNLIIKKRPTMKNYLLSSKVKRENKSLQHLPHPPLQVKVKFNSSLFKASMNQTTIHHHHSFMLRRDSL